ncbi:MAG: type 1 periplasmic binding fold superfamily protein [Bacteroidota bacterium]
MKTQTMSILRSMLLLVAVLLFSQCKTEDPEPEHEEELITTLKMTFSPVGGGDDVVFSLVDMDGPGEDEPVYTNGTLAANTDYNVTIEVRNDEENDDITAEIVEEDEEHQFFFETAVSLYLEFSYEDADDNGDPIGLSTIFYAQEPSDGTLTVTLRHEPDKSADGARNGDPSNAGGETDIEATFDVVIE